MKIIDLSPIPFLKNFIVFIKTSFGTGNLLDGCNLIGKINLFNATFANCSIFNLYPGGDYLGN